MFLLLQLFSHHLRCNFVSGRDLLDLSFCLLNGNCKACKILIEVWKEGVKDLWICSQNGSWSSRHVREREVSYGHVLYVCNGKYVSCSICSHQVPVWWYDKSLLIIMFFDEIVYMKKKPSSVACLDSQFFSTVEQFGFSSTQGQFWLFNKYIQIFGCRGSFREFIYLLFC